VTKKMSTVEEYTPERSAILEWVIGLWASERVLKSPLVIEDEERVDLTSIPGNTWPSDSCFEISSRSLVEGFFETMEK